MQDAALAEARRHRQFDLLVLRHFLVGLVQSLAPEQWLHPPTLSTLSIYLSMSLYITSQSELFEVETSLSLTDINLT